MLERIYFLNLWEFIGQFQPFSLTIFEILEISAVIASCPSREIIIAVFPVTIQIKLDQSFRLNLFLSYLQRIAFLGELLGQRSRHESLRRPLIEPVRRHIVLNTFGSLESRDFRTRKNPSINRFSLAVSSLPHIPY